MNRKDLLITFLIVNGTLRVFFACLKGHNKKCEVKIVPEFSSLKGSTLSKKRADTTSTHKDRTNSAIHYQKLKYIWSMLFWNFFSLQNKELQMKLVKVNTY